MPLRKVVVGTPHYHGGFIRLSIIKYEIFFILTNSKKYNRVARKKRLKI
jgi:hypothetical protein